MSFSFQKRNSPSLQMPSLFPILSHISADSHIFSFLIPIPLFPYTKTNIMYIGKVYFYSVLSMYQIILTRYTMHWKYRTVCSVHITFTIIAISYCQFIWQLSSLRWTWWWWYPLLSLEYVTALIGLSKQSKCTCTDKMCNFCVLHLLLHVHTHKFGFWGVYCI